MNEELKKELKKINIMLYIILGALGLIFTVMLTKVEFKSNNTNVKETEKDTNENYDVSMMKEVSVSEALKLFDSNKAYVLYIGRSDCSACIAYLPTLQEVQSERKYTTQYLDLNKLDMKSSDATKLYEKMNLKTTLSINGEDVTNTYGYFFGNYGYTPVTIIINKGKMAGGSIGAIEKSELISILDENGIE